MSDIVFDGMVFDRLREIGDQSDRIAALESELARLRLTDAEREFLQALHGAYQEMANQTGSVNAAAQADSRKNAATLRGLLERIG